MIQTISITPQHLKEGDRILSGGKVVEFDRNTIDDIGRNFCHTKPDADGRKHVIEFYKGQIKVEKVIGA